MITDSSSAASDSQACTLCGPLKYAPVTRQNCRPQTVNRAMSTSISNVQDGRDRPRPATQSSESTSSLPQSSEVGVNISTPARYRAILPVQVSS